MIIADTNVVSETMRDQPDRAVLDWAESLNAGELAICVVTVQQIESRIGRLPTGRRRAALVQRWSALVETFSDAIEIYDVMAAQATARILVAAETLGHPISLADAQIAGICVTRGKTLATRNVRDFDHVAGLCLINPFG